MKQKTLFIIVIAVICGGITFITLGMFGVIPVGSILIQLTYILSLSVIFLFALVGSYFFGMLTTHHIIRGSSFTPFERSMLEMREDVKKLVEETEELKKRLGEIEKKQ
jgi:hypothetical protein